MLIVVVGEERKLLVKPGLTMVDGPSGTGGADGKGGDAAGSDQ